MQLKGIEKSLAVFCLATYGEGDPTDNAMEFWEWIQGDLDLTGLNYAVSLIATVYPIVCFYSACISLRDLFNFNVYIKQSRLTCV